MSETVVIISDLHDGNVQGQFDIVRTELSLAENLAGVIRESSSSKQKKIP